MKHTWLAGIALGIGTFSLSHATQPFERAPLPKGQIPMAGGNKCDYTRALTKSYREAAMSGATRERKEWGREQYAAAVEKMTQLGCPDIPGPLPLH